MNKDIRKAYIKNLKNSLVYIGGVEKKSLNALNREIELYIDKDTTYDDLVVHFGKPEEIADSFKEEYDDTTLMKKIKLKKVFITIGVILIMISILILSLFMIEKVKSRNSYITREVEVIVENK